MRIKSVFLTKSIQFRTLSQFNVRESFKCEKIAFIGNDDFSIPSLEAMRKILPAAALTVVVSNKNNLVGKHADKNQLQIVEWRDFLTNCSKHVDEISHFDLGVVASFGKLIPELVIRRFKEGILNVHGSVLPRWRGAAPISHALFNNDTRTGVTIMKIAPNRFDVGPILHKKEVPIPDHIRAGELRTLLSHLGSKALEEVLTDLDLFLGNPLPQNENEATLAPRLTQQMAQVDWGAESGAIYNLFRGFGGTSKFLWTNFEGKHVDLDEIGIVKFDFTKSVPSFHLSKSVISIPENCHKVDWDTNYESFYSSPPSQTVRMRKEEMEGISPGEIKLKEKSLLCVKCGNDDESWVFVQKLKIGKKWMNGKDFYNGFISSKKIKPPFQYVKEQFINNIEELNKVKM